MKRVEKGDPALGIKASEGKERVERQNGKTVVIVERAYGFGHMGYHY
jgi:hypothetical protein